MERKIVINSSSIKPIIENNETQIILQRHCNYDRSNGSLLDESKKQEEKIVEEFLKNLSCNALDDTYFLLVSSNTVNSNSENKRCVDTLNIAMNLINEFLESKGIDKNHIINLDETLNYKSKVKETQNLSEPTMFTDNTGYLEFLKNKNDGINLQFWIDFESDTYKNERESLNAEGPDEIVSRGIYYLNVIQRYASYFHMKKPNSKLIVWCCTHYDLISPFAKQTIFGLDKEESVSVDYCGGISLKFDKSNNIIASVNNSYYPVYFQDMKQLHRHL